jgi:hypothetical protein
MSGPLAASFGVCANGMAPDDGRVVAFDHGCGAHSQIAAPQARAAARPVLVYDTEPDLLF